MKISKLCIIAGSGNLPVYALTEALSQKVDLVVYLLDMENQPLMAGIKDNDITYRKINLGKFDVVLKNLKSDGVTHVIIIGKVHKKTLLSGINFNIKTLLILKKLKDWNDTSIFNLVADEINSIGVKIVDQKIFLKSLLCSPGVYSKKKPSKSEWGDIEFGMGYAKKISALDIGQTVVVANKTLLSVEAIEGTDEAIKRGGSYAKKNSAVVCKAMHKNQDTRFDVPSVGIHTLEIMRQSGCGILAIDAKNTFVIDRELFQKKVNDYKMIFVTVNV